VIPQGTKPAGGSDLERLLAQSLADLDLSPRVAKALQAIEVETLRDLVRMTEKELGSMKNFGQKSLKEVTELLEKMDLTLGMNV